MKLKAPEIAWVLRKAAVLALLPWILLSLLAPFSRGSTQASPVSPKQRPNFSAAVISAAKSRLGGSWSQITIVQRDGKGPLANTREVSPGQYRVTIYPESFLGNFPGFLEGLADLTDPYAEGILCGTLLHEQQHACLGVPGLQIGSPDCRAKQMSCEHLAIDFTAHSRLCTLAQQERAAATATPPTGSWDTYVGLCHAAKELETRWNNPKAAGVARECCKPDGNPECRFEPDPDCPETDIPRPDGCQFPNNVVLPPCGACEGL